MKKKEPIVKGSSWTCKLCGRENSPWRFFCLCKQSPKDRRNVLDELEAMRSKFIQRNGFAPNVAFLDSVMWGRVKAYLMEQLETDLGIVRGMKILPICGTKSSVAHDPKTVTRR